MGSFLPLWCVYPALLATCRFGVSFVGFYLPLWHIRGRLSVVVAYILCVVVCRCGIHTMVGFYISAFGMEYYGSLSGIIADIFESAAYGSYVIGVLAAVVADIAYWLPDVW